MSRAAVALLLALGAARLAAQPPDDAWRTLETPHFRVHYPAATDLWSTRLAAHLEQIRDAVDGEVGYAPPERVDVVVADPLATANGSAWPLLTSPRMVVWVTPPHAATPLGQISDWGELVSVHEYAHLAHLLRPSRSPLRAGLGRALLPLGPLALGAPRWVSEGYATLLEGRLTGAGRPSSAWRAAVLREWARQGRLPSYARLSADREAFLGQSMAYLAGSAFLEWLERRAGDRAVLPRLWAAATAREPRRFAAAFARVFGDSPPALWARFQAESSAAALAAERALEPWRREGEVWLDRHGDTRALTVSPDGRRLAALTGERQHPLRLAVWDLDAPPRDSRRPSKALPDPADPAPQPRPARHRPLVTELVPAPGTRIEGARFLPAGDELLLVRVAPDRRGVRHADLARWRPGQRPRPLTRGADLRDADPAPDGRTAFAVRWRAGFSGLLAVDLVSGALRELAPPSLELLHDHPRVAPDGRTLAWLVHLAGRWRLALAPITPGPGLGAARELAPATGGEPVDFAWRGDGSLLYVTVARAGALEIEAWPVTTAASAHQVTRAGGAALAPAPTADGSTLFYLALDADGMDVRRLALDAATVQEPPPSPSLPPAARALDAVVAQQEAPPPSRPYGLGRGVWRPLLGGQTGSESGGLEVGAHGGDVLGRWELRAVGAFAAQPAVRGGALVGTLRRLPATTTLHLARFRDGDGEHSALELSTRGEVRFGTTRLALAGGLGWDRRRASGPGGIEERGVLSAAFELRRPLRFRALTFEPRLALAGEHGWADADFRFRRLGLGLDATSDAGTLSLGWEVGRSSAGSDERFRLGGHASSVAPALARPGRMPLPALAEGALGGDRYRALRVRVALRSSPLALIGEEYQVGDSRRLRLLGAELRWRLPALPLAALPALTASAGLARVDGGGLGTHTRWWLGLTFPPGATLAAPPGVQGRAAVFASVERR